MKISDLIQELENLRAWHGDLEVVCFASGEVHPALAVQKFEGVVEIGCGWEPLEEAV